MKCGAHGGSGALHHRSPHGTVELFGETGGSLGSCFAEPELGHVDRATQLREMAAGYTLPPPAALDIHDAQAADKWKRFK